MRNLIRISALVAALAAAPAFAAGTAEQQAACEYAARPSCEPASPEETAAATCSRPHLQRPSPARPAQRPAGAPPAVRLHSRWVHRRHLGVSIPTNAGPLPLQPPSKALE